VVGGGVGLVGWARLGEGWGVGGVGGGVSRECTGVGMRRGGGVEGYQRGVQKLRGGGGQRGKFERAVGGGGVRWCIKSG